MRNFTAPLSKRLNVLAMTLLAVTLASCGGAGSPTITGGSGSSSSGNAGSTSSGSSSSTSTTAAHLTLTRSAATLPPDGSSTSTITATVTDSSNVVVSGTTVKFSASAGALAVTSDGATDSNGHATAVLSTEGVAVGTTITVTATVSGQTSTTTVLVASSSGTASASALSLVSSALTIPNDGSSTATLTVIAKNDGNNVIAGVQVCFTADGGALNVSGGSNGCVTTDTNGSAIATLSANGLVANTPITVTAKAGSLTQSVQVKAVQTAVSSTSLQFGNTGVDGSSAFTAGVIAPTTVPSVATGGTTTLAVAVVDSTNVLYNSGTASVAFNSTCLASGAAKITAGASGTVSGNTATTSTGFASVTYTNVSCSIQDAITATATAAGQTYAATGSVNSVAPTVGSIQFVSATNTSIGLKGTGLNETSVLTYKVLNSTGGAVQGQSVSFALNTTVGGLYIPPDPVVSGSDGTVQVTVQSGTVHTTVRVTATTSSGGTTYSTQSSLLTVTTGLPTSRGFSIAMESHNVEGYDWDGVTSKVTVILSDRYGNPAPDGTAVAFTTDGGQIGGSCNTSGGTCNVTWTSANPRPAPATASPYPNPGVPPSSAYGRATILATVIGEETFNDANGDGFYDNNEVYDNLGEPYRDDNQNGQYDNSNQASQNGLGGEYFLDFGTASGDGTQQNQLRDGSYGTFMGITCTGTTASDSCSKKTLALGATANISMSTSTANPTVNVGKTTGLILGGTADISLAAGSTGTLAVNVQDRYGNSMPAGTTVAFKADDTSTLSASAVGAGVVPDDSGAGGQDYYVNLKGAAAGATHLIVTVTSPKGTVTTLNLSVNVTP